MPLYLARKTLNELDAAAAEAATEPLLQGIREQYKQALAPEPMEQPEQPAFRLPSLESLGVTAQQGASSITDVIGAIPQRARETAESLLPQWTLPSLESLGVTPPQQPQQPQHTEDAPRSESGMPAPATDAAGSLSARADGISPVGLPSAPPSSTSRTGYAPSTGQGVEGVERWSDLVREAAQAYNLPEATIKGLMEIESGGNPEAVSAAGAQGLMQVMPFHFKPGENPRDPRTNIMRGAKVYADALARYGDPDKAAAAYFGAIDANGNITSATDATGTDGHKYVALWRAAASKYGSGTSPNAGAAQPPAPAPAPQAPATGSVASSPPATAAGGSGGSDTVTIEHIDNGRRMTVPRSTLAGYLQPPAPGVPSMWRVVEAGAEGDMPRLSLGGGTPQPMPEDASLEHEMIQQTGRVMDRKPPPLRNIIEYHDTTAPLQGDMRDGGDTVSYRLPIATDPEATTGAATPTTYGEGGDDPGTQPINPVYGPEPPALPSPAIAAVENARAAMEAEEELAPREPRQSPIAAAAEAGQAAYNDPLWQTAPAPARAARIISETFQTLGGKAAREVAAALGVSDDELINILGFSISGQDVAEFAGGAVADPTNWVGAGPTFRGVRQVAGPVVAAALDPGGALLEGAGRAVRGVGTRVTDALAENAENVARADARMAEQGSTMAPAAFGSLPESTRPTVEVLQQRLEAARRNMQRSLDAGDYEAADVARERVAQLESALVDARNARRALEPAIESDVGRRIEGLPLDERTADDLALVGRERAVPDDLSGPVGVPVDTSGRANAGAGVIPEGRTADPLSAVNRVLGQGVASAVSGGVGAQVNQVMNPDDPNAATTGFLVGALGPVAAARGARALARRVGARGAGDGLLAAFGHVPTPEMPNRAIAMGADPSRRYEFRYRVADLDDLIPSNLPSGARNPAFPQELQPRGRERVASQQQIQQIARGLEPDALLTDVGRLDSGPMIVGPDNIVESGNGRTLALQRAARQYPERYRAYVDTLRRDLDQYGLTEADLAGIERPVLVRERVSDVDRAAFAQEANNAGLLRMSSFEQAVTDAANLSDDAVTALQVGENDTIASALRKTENRDVVRRWVGTLPENERAGVLDASGQLSAQGYERLTNALLVRTYGQGAGERLARTFIESADPTVRNVQTALMASLPDVARAEALVRSGQRDAGLSIADDVAAATEMLARLRRDGVSVQDYLGQAAMFERELTPLQERILEFLGKSQRRPSAIREALRDYAARVENTADPNQVDMFGGQIAPPSREELWRGATAGSDVDVPEPPLIRAAEENPPAGRAPADGAGLEIPPAQPVPPPVRRAGGAGQAASLGPVARRPGPVPSDILPRGGPEGSLAVEGQPEQPTLRRRPGPIPTDIIPRSGPEGSLAVEGAPPPTPRPGPIPEGMAPRGGPEDVLSLVPDTPVGRRIARNVARAAKNVKPPNLLEIVQNYRHSVGLLGNPLGTGLINAIGGPVSAGAGLATDVVRTGLIKGYPVPAIIEAGSLVTGLAEASRAALGTALGFIPQRVRNAPDFRPPLSERMQSPVGKALGFVIETPGRLAAQTPDAFFNTLFEHWGRRRAANELMMERGVSRLDPAAQVQEIERLLNNPTADEAKRIAEGAKQFADEMTYKGKPGAFERALAAPFRPTSGPTTAGDPIATQVHDLAGSLVMPFYHALFQIQKQAATHTPGLGFVADTKKPMSERVARQVVGAGFGIWVADRAARNLVTGPGPDDPDEKARLKASGWDEWSTYVPGVGYVKSDNFAQAAPMLKAIGAYYDARRYGNPEQDQLKEGQRIVKTVLGAFESFPVIQAVQALYKIAEKPVEGAADLGISVGSSFVPALVRANEASKDPYQRTVDRSAPLAEQIRQRALNRVGSIPGIGSRQDSPPALDRETGEPIENPRRGIGAFISQPVNPKPTDPLIQEMATYGVTLDRARDRFTFTRAGADAPDGAPGSVPVPLPPAWQQEWLRARREGLEQAASAVRGDRQYAGWNEAQRRAAWKKAIEAAERYADRAVKAAHQQEIERQILGAPATPVRRAS